MQQSDKSLDANRREFLLQAGALGGSVALAARGAACEQQAKHERRSRPTFAAFIKFLQSLSYDRLAVEVAKLGFDGIEATVRKGGHVDPERVEEQLPQLVESLNKCGLKVHVMASDVNRADDVLGMRVLKTASELKIPRYRMKYYRYDLEKPLTPQLNGFRRMVAELAEVNRKLGLQAVYQNHAGGDRVGAPVWDLVQILEGLPLSQAGVAFDIRHATVEGGLAWPLHFSRVLPHLGAVYVKDFIWDKATRRPRNVPLGEGLVDPAFFQRLKSMRYDGVISLHVEYLPQSGIPENLKALRDDLATLRRLLTDKPVPN